ncbi:hypothetical protein [Xenorhabdus innexi]|uniref:Monofunctional biosynthetic peptidoglycan transglycosylase n=1 Tax=Xenorhabdus innexi TaxID=290109 RepID=A0A1N6MQ91_9GAMM
MNKIVLTITFLWFVAVITFSFLPAPFSMVMPERQAGALISINLSYVFCSIWGQDQISPYTGFAVITTEDQ